MVGSPDSGEEISQSRAVVLALPATPAKFSTKTSSCVKLSKATSVESFLRGSAGDGKFKAFKRKKRYEEWDAKGGFNIRVNVGKVRHIAKAITDLSMARTLGVEPGVSVTSTICKKRAATTSPLDPSGDWNLKRNKSTDLQSDATHDAFSAVRLQPLARDCDPATPPGFHQVQLGHQYMAAYPITIQIQAVWDKSTLRTGIGWAAHSPSTQPPTCYGAFVYSSSSIAALATACFKAVAWAVAAGHSNIMLQTSSTQLIHIIRSNDYQDISIKWTIEAIRRIGYLLRSCQWESGRLLEMLKARWYGLLYIGQGGVWQGQFSFQEAQTAGCPKVELECDAYNLLTAIKQQHYGRSLLDLVVEDIVMLRSTFANFSIYHVKRGGNIVAHLLTRVNPSNGVEQVFVDDVQLGILTLTELDVG
ncbi:hypothetical protein BVRB_5g100110 [Beta vulgaris subsp. vulgaris]|nr:hypothetical protein BVRB_5g100110 [Beta vulgaris subsp. vulgaris]